MNYELRKSSLSNWSYSNKEIEGLAITGSYARNTQKPDFDIDVCLFVKDPLLFIEDHKWALIFGDITSKETEDWGVVKTLRVFYKSEMEVEFNFSTLERADIPEFYLW